jgi:UDP-3-O-acyl N-acetylglucosamine deacetylase
MDDTILVVDDEEQIRTTLRGILGDEGFQVLDTGDGTQILDLVRTRQPRLVILDIWMPQLDGISLLEQLKAQRPELPVIVISGHGTIETAVRATKLGATDFIEKPFSLEALLRSVYRAIGREAADHTAQAEHHAPPPNRQAAVRPRECVQARTIGRSVVLRGQGLHSGVRTGVILQPLPPGSGIVFGSLSTDVVIPASVDYVSSTGYATSLYRDGAMARTVEHLMAALHGYGISNLMIKMQDEIPILDGSAREFCQLLDEAGVVEQDETVEVIAVDRPYQVGDGGAGKGLRIEPADHFSVRYILDYPPPVGRQEYCYVHRGAESFCAEIAPARTFGFLKEVQALEQMGLANGGRLDNCILIGDQGVINPPLRFDDELARHKVLDLIGDLYLLGRPLRGKVTADRTGHGDNIALVRALREGLGLQTTLH